ncbi:diguanylate phosphodiesterase, partial [Vibrio vulnificus]|uniref:EAL domain-containing protein n=1 Tax=Vibrio vulnificus TaxID=672 RepID=UPI000CC06156
HNYSSNTRLRTHYFTNTLNLHVTPFANRHYFKWFRDELLQLPSEYRTKLSFEFVESHLVRHLDYMRPVAKMLSGLGCQLVVGQAGRTIVSTHYLKDLGVDYLKLHRSLTKKIEQRHENQLFVRSMLGAGAGTKVRVIAVGVETKQEWSTLVELGIHGGQGRYFSVENQWLPPVVTTVEEKQTKTARRNRWRRK